MVGSLRAKLTPSACQRADSRSERCCISLLGDKALEPFRIIFVCVVPIGALMTLDLVWDIADVLNALMAVPNLIGLLLLSPVLFKISKEYNK